MIEKHINFLLSLKKIVIYIIGIIECHEGAFGYNCVNNCSGHCLNNSACNKQTGHCDRGCNPGYTKSDCSKGKSTDRCTYAIKKCICYLFNIRNASLYNLNIMLLVHSGTFVMYQMHLSLHRVSPWAVRNRLQRRL